MAGFYVLACLVLLVLHAAALPDSLRLIVSGAFTGHAAVGGFAGAGIREAVRFGIARGLFSNESGLGSAPIVAAAAQTTSPVRQALVSSTGTFWDTVVLCALTGLVVVSSGHWREGLTGAALSRAAFADLPGLGPPVLALALLTFVFSTILGWSYYGEKAAEYLLGPRVVTPYRVLWVVAVMAGSVVSLPAVWAFADVANGLMAVPNLVCLLLMAPLVAAETRAHLGPGAPPPGATHRP
jgi:AGCS family alanine or glycine:cation symporter